MRTLDTSCLLVVGSAGVTSPGPSQWKSGVSVTPVGRVTEQVRVTLSPAMTEEDGKEMREMMTVSVEIEMVGIHAFISYTITYNEYFCSSHSTG